MGEFLRHLADSTIKMEPPCSSSIQPESRSLESLMVRLEIQAILLSRELWASILSFFFFLCRLADQSIVDWSARRVVRILGHSSADGDRISSVIMAALS